MRLRSIAALCAFIALAAPSQAQSPGERVALTRNTLNCGDWYTARRYIPSLAACTAAVAGFERAAAIQNNPWYAYYMKATVLRYKALDESALGHHRAALRSAIEAHRLASYVYTTYHIDPDDYRSINALVAQLQPIEAQEAAYIRRGIGD